MSKRNEKKGLNYLAIISKLISLFHWKGDAQSDFRNSHVFYPTLSQDKMANFRKSGVQKILGKNDLGKNWPGKVLTRRTFDSGWKIFLGWNRYGPHIIYVAEIAVGKNSRFGRLICSMIEPKWNSAKIFCDPVDHVMFQIWNLSASCSFHRLV